MDYKKMLGIDYGDLEPSISPKDHMKYINIKLATLGLPIYKDGSNDENSSQYMIDLFEHIIEDYKEKKRLIDDKEIPINRRVSDFFTEYFSEMNEIPKIIKNQFVLDHYGLARELSLPPNGDEFSSEYSKSYRIKQGILNNPKHDRRTTKGSFHIVEGNLRVPFDKKEVPKIAFTKLYKAAANPPEELKVLPYTALQEKQAKTFVSLLVKPTISPKVEGVIDKKYMETLFIVPGSLVTNLDFVESVFGNAGDFSSHFNDSGLDVDHWSGHTGYIILAPHLTKLKKKDMGLPQYDDATHRQKKDGMCYKTEDEIYNDGVPFKLTCRDKNGVVITLIADSYFGYSKKEIKTQMSYAANLFGMSEEEHSGGTIAFSRRSVGESFTSEDELDDEKYKFEEVKEKFSDLMVLHEDNYGVDKKYSNIIYLPENIEVNLSKTTIKWMYNGKERLLKLMPTYAYILPSGDKLHMEKHPVAPAWKLVKTAAEGLFCHKPCTVSGGGKSEISKSLENSIIYGTYYIHDLEKDLGQVEKILNYDYRKRWKATPNRTRASRTILSPERTLGSVIKLLTPSKTYTDKFNKYLDDIPNYIKALVFMVKRFYLPEWGDNWREHFTVDQINGQPGNEINYNNRKIRPSYLRVGFDKDGSWRIFKLRMDFMSAEKLQMEDDITASVVIPRDQLNYLDSEYDNKSFKFAVNSEYRFFQRPDEAIHIGYDTQAEYDLSQDNLFVTNYEPLVKEDVKEIRENVMDFVSYTDPVKEHINGFLESDSKYCIISSEPRILEEGAISKNPRYLENRGDFINPIKNYIADVGVRLARKVPMEYPILLPVNAVLAGRRNNPPSEENGQKILPLSVYNPIHYQELPELFMDFMASLSGKSPSTTGSGSEGALTKGPFNMLLPAYDLNNALISYILTGYSGFSTPAGHIGPEGRVDHDISMFIPEMWCKLDEVERDPKNLIASGAFEKVNDFIYDGKEVKASRLGYRVTSKFAYQFMGKIFDESQTVFDEKLLKPEAQDLNAFVDGVNNIVSGHKKIAEAYISDGTVDEAILPLKALIHIMAKGSFEGMTIHDEKFRKLFDYNYVIESDWYKQRLRNKQIIDVQLINKKIKNLERFIINPINKGVLEAYGYKEKLLKAKEKLKYYESKEYLKSLVGTIGAGGIAI